MQLQRDLVIDDAIMLVDGVVVSGIGGVIREGVEGSSIIIQVSVFESVFRWRL